MNIWKPCTIATIVMLLVLSCITAYASEFKNERYYSNYYCDTLAGSPTTLPSGIHPDCESALLVYEFDWAVRKKLYECIGQAWYYAEETGKLPVCAMLVRSDTEMDTAKNATRVMKKASVLWLIYDVRTLTSH